ncbi:odorant receptor 131-2-like [Dendropsophus ebraccatus]|uniref:odorant receptor 131-2-like n=1 Tax=Dendropsophus ebraccatus TaxID=150705 RepID=UPI003831A0C5
MLNVNNKTTTQVYTTGQILKTTIVVLMPLCFGIFVYFMAIILKVFFTAAQVRETSRYILFIHMLLSDVIYLILAFFIFLCAIYRILLPIPLCLVITSFSTCMFSVTPYNLAVMSLERYMAICHPLRYVELCTPQRSCHVIVCMWTVGMVPQIANVIAYCCSANSVFFYLEVMCHWRTLVMNDFQVVMRTMTDIFSFSIVGMTIAFTYVKVMLVARRMDSGNFASKAGKTVLLHAFQLLLSMLSFTTTMTERHLTPYFQYLPYTNFFMMMCFPRFVSPLIYGMRDEVFGKAMRKPPSCQRVCT